MPAPATAVRVDADTSPPPASAAPSLRTALYGGLVGGMIDEIEHRVAGAQADPLHGPEQREDVFHSISVAAGYLGLAACLAATAFGLAAVF